MYLQMILPTYVSDAWLENSFGSWKQRCQNAYSAESIEILTKVATLFLLYYVVLLELDLCLFLFSHVSNSCDIFLIYETILAITKQCF